MRLAFASCQSSVFRWFVSTFCEYVICMYTTPTSNHAYCILSESPMRPSAVLNTKFNRSDGLAIATVPLGDNISENLIQASRILHNSIVDVRYMSDVRVACLLVRYGQLCVKLVRLFVRWCSSLLDLILFNLSKCQS